LKILEKPHQSVFLGEYFLVYFEPNKYKKLIAVIKKPVFSFGGSVSCFDSFIPHRPERPPWLWTLMTKDRGFLLWTAIALDVCAAVGGASQEVCFHSRACDPSGSL
jgi:hypothetical protein